MLFVSFLWGRDKAYIYDIVEYDVVEEDVAKEDVVNDDFFEEEIVKENIFKEHFVKEDFVQEDFVKEVIESSKLPISDYSTEKLTFKDFEKRYKDKYAINWGEITAKLGTGTAVIVITGMVSGVATATGNGFASLVAFAAFKGAVEGAISGAAIGVGIGALKAKLENDERATSKYMIEEAADGYMWGAIIGAVVGVGLEWKAAKAGKTVSTGAKEAPAVLPAAISFTKIPSETISMCRAAVKSFIAKGSIKLTETEIEGLKNGTIKTTEFVYTKIGKNFEEGYKEFFIRLNKKNVEALFEGPYVKKPLMEILRGKGGMHEWLKRAHCKKFLTDPKFEKDGDLLFYMQDIFVQKTENVMFKNGARHPSAIAKNTKESDVVHRELASILDSYQPGNLKGLFRDINDFAKETLTRESYDDFKRIFDALKIE